MVTSSKLRIYERDRIYPQSISYYHKLMYLSPQKHAYVANHWEVRSFVHDYFYWARAIDELGQSARQWINSWVTIEDKWQEIKSLYENDYKNISAILSPLHDRLVTDYSSNELLMIYSTALNFAEEHINYAEYTIDGFDDFFSDSFSEYLHNNFEVRISKIELADLLKPATLSAQSRYQKEIIGLVLAMPSDTIEQICSRYFWTKMSWDGSNELTNEEVEKDIATISKKDSNDLKNEYDRLANYEARALSERRDILNKYELNLEDGLLANYFKLLDAFNTFHDYRKEIQMRTNQVIYRVLNELPQRFSVDYHDLLYYFPNEIITLIKNGNTVDRDIIKKRQQGITFIIEEGKVTEYIGVEAVRILEEYVLKNRQTENVKKIIGIPASKGIIKGRTFVTKIVKEANELLSAGDILVTSMTTVDFVPAMRRAAAIITDDGGITCHAAVVSRELGIPCIVGTKIATSVLKTGDIIRMDATSGIIIVE